LKVCALMYAVFVALRTLVLATVALQVLPDGSECCFPYVTCGCFLGPNFEYATETHEELLYDKQKLLGEPGRPFAALCHYCANDFVICGMLPILAGGVQS
jgi:hypothetical protein